MIAGSFRKHVLRRRSGSGNEAILRHLNKRVDVGQLVAPELLPPPGSSVAEPDLHSGFCQLGALGQLFPGVDVGVVGPFESALQLLQLLRRESSATPPLLPFDFQPGLGVTVR